MENILSLSDEDLELSLRRLVGMEVETLFDVLVHIREVDVRRLYLRRGKPSLFEYLVTNCRYSPPAAQRRLDASRLSLEIPELLGKIREGRLNLFQIGVLQRGVRQKEKDAPVPKAKKLEILEKLEYAHYKEVETLVAKELGLNTIARTSQRGQSDGSVRLAITLRKLAWNKLNQCRDFLSHSIPSGDLAAVIEYLCVFYVVRKKRERDAASETEVPPRRTRRSQKPAHEAPIPARTRRLIFARDKCCQYRDPVTHQLCGSTFRLEIDHIKMRAHGGTNDPGNLRLLCAGHNRLAAADTLRPETRFP